MSGLSCKVVNVQEASLDSEACTLKALLGLQSDAVIRDSFVLVSPDACTGRKLTLGYTTVYPGCRTRGHDHDDREEVYFVVSGRGVSVVGDEEFEVRAGDAFHIPFGRFHAMRNPHSTPLEYVWVTAPRDSEG